MLLVVFDLLGMTSGFGQDVVLKKLYDGIEDMRLASKRSENCFLPDTKKVGSSLRSGPVQVRASGVIARV